MDNTNKDHTRNIQYKQGLYKIITEESSELVIEQRSCHKSLNIKEGGKLLSF